MTIFTMTYYIKHTCNVTFINVISTAVMRKVFLSIVVVSKQFIYI